MCPPVTLFDFSRDHDAADAAGVFEKDVDTWRVSDDQVIGGFSRGSAALLRSQRDLDRHLAGETLDTDEGDLEPHDESSGSDNEKFTPFLRWEGKLDTTVGLQSSAQRSGFAALRSPEFPFDGANLQGLYNALEVSCRSDGRVYTINLKVASAIPNDIYQGHIQSAPEAQGRFDRFILPFSRLNLTAMGREREVNRILDTNIKVESIGVVLMDGQDGDFQFDLARIRAINVHEKHGIIEDPEEEEMSASS